MDDFLYRATPWAITLVRHNWPLLVDGVLILWAAICAYRRPTRSTVGRLYGLVTLALAFEYAKAGPAAIRGTTDYLFSAEFNPGPRHASQLVLLQIVPIVLGLVGLAFLTLSLASGQRREGASPPPGLQPGDKRQGGATRRRWGKTVDRLPKVGRDL